MRIPLIAGNWKMNTTIREAISLVKAMLPELDRINGTETVLCPPFISLSTVNELLKNSTVKLGAQNLFYEAKGAYTGEISPLMLAGLCEYVIIGHSERRQYFNETNEMINKKVKAALAAKLKPILCVGERLAENEAGKTSDIITMQIEAALQGIDSLDGLVVAYEPVWAIGTGRAATGEQSNEVTGLLRRLIAKQYNDNVAGKLRILYGGSVTAANTTEFLHQPEIDGALVGGASLKADDFLSIVRQTSEVRKHSLK
ncbi:MAG: triose-phosphate isomerase [Dehalococcoidales bacterium]|nr:triose-phosphate isomerase [Dehalococcoidales bacterium]